MTKIIERIKELRRNSDRFHVATAITGSLIYELDLESGKIRWFGEVEEIFGMPKEKLPKSLPGIMEFIHPGDRSVIMEEIEKEINGVSSESIDCRIRNKSSGSWKKWNLCIVTVEAEAGILKKIYGICRESFDG